MLQSTSLPPFRSCYRTSLPGSDELKSNRSNPISSIADYQIPLAFYELLEVPSAVREFLIINSIIIYYLRWHI